VLCFCARHLTLVVSLSTQEYKWVPANCWGNLTNCGGVNCDGLASRPGGVQIILAASCYRNWDKLWQLCSKASNFRQLVYYLRRIKFFIVYPQVHKFLSAEDSRHFDNFYQWTLYSIVKDRLTIIYMDIDQVLFCVFINRDGVEVCKLAKKERGQYPAILTEQAWSIKDLLYSSRTTVSCGTRRVAPSGQDSSILPAWVANHSTGFDSSCLFTELAI